MIFGSVCAGIEAASVAWEPLGWKASWLSEIDPFPCSVLVHHYPDVPNLGDMTLLENHEQVANTPLDLLVGGTPCQGFSVAGLRKGLADDRSNLALSYVRLALWRRPRWLVWENVPGAFTTGKGQDFGSFLSGLSGVDVSVPEGGWKNSGVVVGASGHYGLAWRVLDAQYAGVPQRRRRIFVVGYLGDWRRAAAVLFERESLHGNPPPRRESRKDFTYDVAPCLAASGRGFERPGDSRGQDCLIASTLNASMGKGKNGQDLGALVTHSLRADGFDASEDGTGRGTPLVPVSFNLRGREGGSMPEPDPDSLASMCAASGGSSRSYIAFSCKDSGSDAGEIAPTLRAGGHGESHANAGVMPAVAYAIQERAVCENPAAGPDGAGFREDDKAYTLETRTVPQAVAFLHCNKGRPDGRKSRHTEMVTVEEDNIPTLTTNGLAQSAVVATMAVRRLTPVECARLQGFPDEYLTSVRHKGKPPADGPMYKALGNSFAVPVVRWLGQRIQLIEDTCRTLNLPLESTDAHAND